ncbi:MAG: YdcH family protein [Candidatus Puniceispirillaceae bacterium]
MTEVANQDIIQVRLDNLISEHRDLDDVIDRLTQDTPINQLQLQRLKKRKLMLKDEIIKLRAHILPDIIA